MDNVILKIVAEVYGLTVSEILSKSKVGKEPEASRMVTFFLKALKEKPKDIAYSINRERAMIYHNVKTMTFEINTYKDVQQKFKTVKMSLLTYLENTKTDLENWLKNNPENDLKEREKRLDRLANVNETYNYIINLKPQ